MIRTANGIQKIAMTAGAALMMSSIAPLAATAQTTHHSIFHRHPTATGGVAGIAAYRAAKHTGSRRMASGRHRNFMQRHPVATGVGAAVLAHHYAKKH